MKLFPISKRSQSEVVSTVLLVLIAIVAITIIAVFAINFVKNQIEKSKCFDVVDLIEIRNNPSYTCFNSVGKNFLAQIHFAEANSQLDGFILELGGADTKTYRILNNTALLGVSLFSGSSTLILPSDNTEKTYNISGIDTKPETVKAYPILKGGKSCQSAASLTQIPYCS